MLKHLLLFTLAIFILSISQTEAQEKIPLGHDDYDSWKNLEHQQISRSGQWVTYEANPQDGDGALRVYHTLTGTYRSFKRGYKAVIAPGGSFIAFGIKAQKDTIRQAMLDGKKKDDLPKDSLGIYLTVSDSLTLVSRVKSFKAAPEGKDWLAYLLEKELPVKDSTAVSDTLEAKETEKAEKKKPAKKQKGNTMVVTGPAGVMQARYEHVTEYIFSRYGDVLLFISTKKDSIDSVSVHYMVYPGLEAKTIYHGPGYAKKAGLDREGEQAAYLFSADTGKVKQYELYHYRIGQGSPENTVNASTTGMPEGWCVSEHSNIYFSENGKRLFFGTAAIPEEEPKDTLTDEEKVSVDIWNWKDPLLQPQQLKQLDSDRKKNYLAVYHIPSGNMVQLATEEADRISMDKKHNGPYALGISRAPYYQDISWDADNYQDIYLVKLSDGSREMILQKWQSTAHLSRLGRYVAYYNELDSSWNAYTVKTGRHRKLSGGLPVCFSYEEFDMPTTPGPYGMKGWNRDEDRMFVYDRYDLWMLDPEGKNKPVNLTGGRKDKTRFRYITLDPDEEFIPEGEKLLLSAFNEESRAAGFYDLTIGNEILLEKIMMGDYRFHTPVKALEGDLLIWNRMTFREYPDLRISQRDFSAQKVISNINPQQENYLWGNVELVKWNSADGVELEGLLYKPENFDPDSTYPMIIYFYEKYSSQLHSHYPPRPSRSTVNFTYYASNGYLVFVPDIVYKTGFPGQSAYSAIVSGALHLMKNPWVDSEHIGIQGQSWGGYQVAYLVTQTNMFAAAMAGAPVSNMTSAYGGIRWGSGMSRMFQYEGSQSRIGGTLWEKPWRYIENSPVFFADKVETPLLMMHNDNDGAVPWYQGIEYFVALRRLGKPVWMLTYNGAPHNLKRRADSKDLSIRMQQFFDHYLKGAPAPLWMEKGIPAIDKGKEMGYELVEE